MKDLMVKAGSGLMIALFLMVVMSGCATSGGGAEKNVNLQPIFSYKTIEKETGYKLNALGPLVEVLSEQSQWSLAIRPLFYYRKTGDSQFWELEFLYPLGRCRVDKNGDRTFRLIPFFRRDDYKTDAKTGHSKMEFLTLFWGRTPQGEEYGGFFPLAGGLSQRFNRDRIQFFLWPLYLESSKGDSSTRHILWPFISFTSGEEQKGSKFLPFYSYHENLKDNSKDLALMWPLFAAHEDEQKSSWMLLPLVVKSESIKGEKTTWYLWPLFSHSVYEHGEQWNAPWPILNINKGSDRRRVKVFPLFKTEKARGEQSSFFLWPLYQFQENQYPEVLEMRHRILLLDGVHIEQYKDGLNKEVNFWPLFRYIKGKDGSQNLSIPVLFPIKDEGLERNYEPLVSVFNFQKKTDGTTLWDLLWGLATYKKKEQTSSFELSFLYQYKRKAWRKYYSFLGGLISFHGGFSSRRKSNQNEKTQ